MIAMDKDVNNRQYELLKRDMGLTTMTKIIINAELWSAALHLYGCET